MYHFVLSCCSTADLTREQLAARDIPWVCFHFALDGISYPDDLGASLPYEEFYHALRSGEISKTSQVNVEQYLEHFEPFLLREQDVLHVTLSSGISGTYNSACAAAALLKEKYPERTVEVVDSLGASSGYGLLMEELADLRDKGKSLEEAKQWCLQNRLRVRHWFFSTDLTSYIRGGRISAAAGLTGRLLGICPLLDMDAEGHLVKREKVRSKKKVMERMVEKMTGEAENGGAYQGRCYISHSGCRQDGEAVAALVKKRMPLVREIRINYVGTAIGSHTGPGTVALFFMSKEPRT